MTCPTVSGSPRQTEQGVASPFLTQRELAERWRLSIRTIQRKRNAGTAPDHIVLGKAVLYPLAAVLAFEAKHLRKGPSA